LSVIPLSYDVLAAARNRGESFGPRKYAVQEVLALDPLPCWRHLSPEQYQAQAMYEAYADFVAAFREAAEKLRGGDRMARFPEGSFPPGLPFVRGCLSAA